MSRKITFLTLFLWLMTVTFPVIAQQKADTTYTFRFVPQKDMFYVPWNGNDTELARLLECIERNRTDILDGRLPLLVDGYCNSLGSETENLATAKIRANRVKSELIIRAEIKEENFITRNHATEGDFVTVRLTVPVKGTAATDAEARRKAETERLEAEKRAEQERLAEEQRKAMGGGAAGHRHRGARPGRLPVPHRPGRRRGAALRHRGHGQHDGGSVLRRALHHQLEDHRCLRGCLPSLSCGDGYAARGNASAGPAGGGRPGGGVRGVRRSDSRGAGCPDAGRRPVRGAAGAGPERVLPGAPGEHRGGHRPGKLPADHQRGGLIPMLVPVPRRGPGLNSLLFYRKGGIAEAVTDEAEKGTLQKAQERQLLRFLLFIEIGVSDFFLLAPS